jgi:hypothetical protein
LTLDKVVIALIVSGMVIFASFQIKECVEAHENPSTHSLSVSKPRSFPGLMICPFGQHSIEYDDVYELDISDSDSVFFCPKWSNDALLSFDFEFSPFLFNDNRHVASGRQKSTCPKNNIGEIVGTRVNGFNEALFFLGLDKTELGTTTPRQFTKFVTVRNRVTSRARVNCLRNTRPPSANCSACTSWTPPNVRCLVYDPSYFDEMAKNKNMDPACNPMREKIANVIDSLKMYVGFKYFDHIFRYTGLIEQLTASGFGRAPSTLSLTLSELRQQMQPIARYLDGSTRDGPPKPNLNLTFFDGLMAVFYDPSKGVPAEMDFTSAPRLAEDLLYSVPIFKKGRNSQPPYGYYSYDFVNPFATEAVEILVDVSFDKRYSSVLTNSYNETSNYHFFETTRKPDNRYNDFEISVKFESAASTSRFEVVTLSILTTLSIILSTASALWSYRDKMVILIIAVVNKFTASSVKQHQVV